jgi:hypothetical protein
LEDAAENGFKKGLFVPSSFSFAERELPAFFRFAFIIFRSESSSAAAR